MDSDDENSESDPKSKSSDILSYRQFAEEIMVCISFTVNMYIT